MDESIQRAAVQFAKTNKKKIAKRRTNKEKFPPDDIPVSVFMAGSPGAGKTESAQNLIERFSKERPILHIDSDDLREEFDSYTGSNSSLFQGATSIIVDKMQDYALKQKQSYIFDGTFTNLERARENITRSIDRGREVFVVYVYQTPFQAWHFVRAREKRDGRVVPKDTFITQYFHARRNVNQLKKEFGRRIQVDLIVKNIDGTDFKYKENIDDIDSHIPEAYTEQQLREGLKS